MLFQKKYNKYIQKYIQLAGASSVKLPDVIIKGPSYMCHLNHKNKNIYLFGEVHKKLSDITCGNEESLRMIDWLQTHVIPKYEGDNILDIFIEYPYKINWSHVPEDNLKEDQKLKLMSELTLDHLLTLTQKIPEHSRIHTIDTRNELSPIFGRLIKLDNYIRTFINSPNYIKYISENHNLLLECLDVVINFHTIQFFKPDNKIINIDEISAKINGNLIKYISGIEKLVQSEPFYEEYKKNIDNTISVLIDLANEVKLDLDSIPNIDFNFPQDEYVPGILHDYSLIKIIKKIDEEYKKFFIDLNQELFTLKGIFHQKYDAFKAVFVEKLQIPDRNIDILHDEFYNTFTFPDFNNISEVADIYISFMGLFMDVYTIGRLLKPYIKSCIIYTGFNHTKNINKKLILYGFKLMNESSPINEIKEESKYDNSKDCVNISNVDLFIS